MRYIGILLIIVSIPAFIVLLNSQPKLRRYAYFALGLFPLTLSALNVDAAFYNLPRWLGYADAISVSLLDTLALALIITRRNVLRQLPFLGMFLLYILAVAASVVVADQFIPATFYLFQLLRILVIFLAVASVVREPDAVKLICLGIATGAIYQGIFAVYQRGTGTFQVSGSFAHQNTLGFMLHFVTIPLLALLMAKKQSGLYLAAVAAAGVAVALSASRGSIAFVCVGIVLLFILSLMRQNTSRKYSLIGATVGLALLVSPVAVAGLNQRFDNLAKAGSYDERAAFEEAATMMLMENPMGVGPNQYPLAANTRGYSSRAGVAWNPGSRSANVHHMYLLMGAETGWLGMTTFAAFLMWIIISGLKFAFQNKRDPVGDLVLGFTVTMIVVAVHGLYEWIFVTYEVQAMFAVALGIMAGSIRARKNGVQVEMVTSPNTEIEVNSTTADQTPALAESIDNITAEAKNCTPSMMLPKSGGSKSTRFSGQKSAMLAPPKSR